MPPIINEDLCTRCGMCAGICDAFAFTRITLEDLFTRAEREAKEEGFEQLAILFEMVGKIEKEHEDRYRKLLEAVKNGTVFEKSEEVVWECGNCGHVVKGGSAPQLCPVCKHPQAYFFIKAQNY